MTERSKKLICFPRPCSLDWMASKHRIDGDGSIATHGEAFGRSVESSPPS